MNNVRISTPDGDIIGERLIETDSTIIIKTAQGRLSIDKTDSVAIYDYTDAAAFSYGTILMIPSIYGQAAYMKTKKNYWVLVWQSDKQANETPAQGDNFLTNGKQLSFTELLQMYVDSATAV